MMFKEALKILKDSPEFRDFIKKNGKSFLFSAFFVLNDKFEPETRQLDYYIDDKSAATFVLGEKVELKIGEFHPVSRITALDEKIVDIGKLGKTITDELGKKLGKGSGPSKVIAILQKIDDVQVWNITCMTGSLRILRIKIDSSSGKILESSEAKVSDYIKINKK